MDPYQPDVSAVNVKYYPSDAGANVRFTVAAVTFKGEEMGLRAKRNAVAADVDF